ncbi:hypothetical protein FEM48_Zijuj08G0193000 [Ziziphus jujuba var. spinosa]|uniref:Leucine-rich repeat receptor-like protein kinase At5g49770 n=1 Tax=Ziziphus jujuba var. spinosa TaxID=714518 RepID=A0A978V0W8_ZIZJJ|nr:hypothetical protein FEM48_Zijuj08G0193000 [Ziziphus jujuba var. spinosa]
MGQKTLVFLLLVFMPILAMATTYNPDFLGLMSLKDDWKNTPPSWTALDPCSEWEGIECTGSRVTSIKLSSMGLEGTMSGEIQTLSELQMLDLSYNKDLTGELPPSIGNLKKLTNLILVGCSFSGTIPDTIGSLEQLVFLSLNSNKFSGRIPPSIGNLSKLYWLDMADNNLEGPIPVSNGSTSGLDMLLHTKHFHFGKNKLSGEIPEKLFSSSMKLIHVLFESNELTGKIPSTLGLVQTLEVVRFDRNNLVGKVPSNLNNLTSVNELDMSNNSFDVSKIPTWFSTLTSLTTLMMESTGLGGELPVDLFSLPSLQTVVLKNNQVNGTLDIGTTYSNHLQLIDLQYNSITEYKKGLYNDTLILANNPVCLETDTGTESYCKVSTDSQSDGKSTYTTLPNNCVPSTCSPNQISSPNCRCAYPYTGILEFRAPSFSDLGNKSIYKELENKLLTSFQSHQLLVDSVALSNPKKGSIYLDLNLEVFPYSRDRFNRTEISEIGFLLSNQTFKPSKSFGPFVFHGDEYENYQVISTEPKKSKSSIGIIIGAAAGGSVLVLLLLLAGVYAFRQKRRAERSSEISNPFVHWDSNKISGDAPQLKGARWFSYEELARYTNNFSAANEIGSGGYGKGLLDPSIGLATKLRGFEKYVDLALRCVEEAGSDRPTMSEVVKEIENIMELAGLNPNAESASTSASYEEVSKPTSYPYPPNKETFDYSGAFPPSKIEPQ